VNGEKIFNTVYISFGYSDFDLDQALVCCKNRTIWCR